MKQGITLLDCTLRDGAHVTGGNFGEKTIRGTIEDLVQSNVDIIEVGFFDNDQHDINSTKFSSIADVKRILPPSKGNAMFSLMADFVDVDSVEPCDGTIDMFRLSFKRHRLDWGLNAARVLMDKGYKCFINPVNCNVYSVEEYLEVIRKVNELKPYGFSIVDTFGVLRKQSLSKIYYLVESSLDPDIVIGLHLHENMGLAFSLAQHFLEIHNPKRKINIDCSLLGMGRTPGNLCIEQIMEHMNENYGTDYNTEPAYDACDDYIAPIKKKLPWGYATPYALSGKFGLHRTYAEFLMGKNRLKTKDIQRILSQVDSEHIEMFDEAYIEKLYQEYVSAAYDDTESKNALSDTLINKKLVVICPGHSIKENKEIIRQEITENSVAISVNFIPEDFDVQYVFCANQKRINNIKENESVKRIVTSNLIDSLQSDYVFSYNDCAFYNDVFCEDSTMMLLRTLAKCGCREVYIAGFDGFKEKDKAYYREDYTVETGKNVEVKTVKQLLHSSLGDMQVHFLTPSVYEAE